MDNAGYHHKSLKTALIENGLKLFDEVGYNKFSLRKVARACGVSEAAPYRHFANKDSLLAAIITQVFEKLDNSLKKAVSKYPHDLGSQLREMAFLYVKFFVENPEYMKFLFFSDIGKHIDVAKGSHKLFENSIQPYKTFISSLENYKKQENNNHTLKRRDIDAKMLASLGLIHGIAVLIAQKGFKYDGDCMELVRSIIWSDFFIK